MDDCIEARSKILDNFKNEYAATMYIAAKARHLLDLSNNALTESEAVSWAIEDRSISELDSYIKKKQFTVREQKYNLINEYASRLYDKKLEFAFRKSAIQSNKSRKLIIYYEGLDYPQCVRLRIILKQYWLEHLQKEIQDKQIIRSS